MLSGPGPQGPGSGLSGDQTFREIPDSGTLPERFSITEPDGVVPGRSNVVFKFGQGDILTLAGFADKADLIDDIAFI